MELLKQQASACGAGCACPSTETAGQMRWVLGMIVLLVAATLVSRAMVKNREASTEPAAPIFPSLAPTVTADSQAPVSPVEAGATTQTPGANLATFRYSRN
jgi:MYXO-CTERM domain-containing protein